MCKYKNEKLLFSSKISQGMYTERTVNTMENQLEIMCYKGKGVLQQKNSCAKAVPI